MRTALVVLFALTGCADEPSFDEEFAKQSEHIEREANRIERDANAQIDLVPQAAEAEQLGTASENDDD